MSKLRIDDVQWLKTAYFNFLFTLHDSSGSAPRAVFALDPGLWSHHTVWDIVSWGQERKWPVHS